MATDTTTQPSSTTGTTGAAGAGSTSTTTGTTGTSTGIASTTGDVSSRITEWRLSSTDIQADLDRGVTIVRTKDNVVGAPTGATDDDVIETMVKGKLQADSEASKASIDVDAKNGEVMLKGTADKADTVGRAIALALDTQGVNKVSSDVKVSSTSSSSSESLTPTGRPTSDTGTSTTSPDKSTSDTSSSSSTGASSTSGSSTGSSTSSSSDTTGASSSAGSTKKDNPNN